jgi:hypothetical protein
MTQQPVSRQEQSASARLSVRRNLARLLLHRSIRPRRHPMVAPVRILHRYRGTALAPNRAGGWLHSLGNDRSDPHHLITVRATESAWARSVRVILEPPFKCRKPQLFAIHQAVDRDHRRPSGRAAWRLDRQRRSRGFCGLPASNPRDDPRPRMTPRRSGCAHPPTPEGTFL